MSIETSLIKKSGKSGLKKSFTIAPACFITWMAMGYILPAQGAVVADINQGNIPVIRANPNGSVTVNINAASAGGISHNKYIQFDTTKQGVVLNNSAESIATSLAGTVAGNKNMAKGAASLIINEVTSNRPSQLNGKIEVAGKKADVIIANPAGVSCDGCGFINAGRSTITTGKLMIENDKLSGINVTNGNITLTGNGMDDKSNYTALLANTVNINAKLNARDLQVMTGVNNNIIVNDNQLTNIGGSGSAKSPVVGLDVSALGGMFADKITLVANQSGVGVNNRGLINAGTNLSINNQGAITNTGKLLTTTDGVELFAKSLTNNYGTITSGKDIVAITDSGINNFQGRIGAKNSAIFNTLSVNNDQGLITAQDISIAANTVNNSNSNKYIAHDEDIPKSNNVKGGLQATSDISVNSSGLLEGTRGYANSESGTVSLVSNAQIILNYSRISGKDINVISDTLDYPARPKPDPIDAKLTATNDINMTIGNLGIFDKTTVLNAGHDINFASLDGKNTGTFSNYGVVSANNNVNYNHGNVANYGTISAGKDITMQAINFTNNGVINSFGNTNIAATGNFLNTVNAVISSGQKAILRAKSVNNQQGTIISRMGIDISTDKLTNTGYISGKITQTPY